MKLTHHITVEYDDETQQAAVYFRLCSSLYGCDPTRYRGALVGDELGRLELVTLLRQLPGVVARDHQEVDGLPRSL